MRSHEVLVKRAVDWGRINSRLAMYPNIRHCFPLEVLQSCKPPYYCHYMAWRLGVWSSEAPFKHLDELLGFGRNLEGWCAKRSLLHDLSFGAFWSLLWELQVAYGLGRGDLDLEWLGEGPDLVVRSGADQAFVECYVYQKKFAEMSFLEELLRTVNINLHLEYGLGRRVVLPQDVTDFFDELCRPLLNRAYVSTLEREAEREYPRPLQLPEGTQNIVIAMMGSNHGAYCPGRGASIWHDDGDGYLAVACNEIVRAKACANKLASYRPNLVAANLALSKDFQSAAKRGWVPEGWPVPTLDSILFCVCGIDRYLDRATVVLELNQEPRHWLLDLLQGS